MLIKQAALASHLKRALSPLYVLIGSDHFLLNEAMHSIKTAWRDQHEHIEEKRITLNQTSDWAMLIEEANSYSLFADAYLIDATWDKKNIDAAGKNALQHYLNAINTSCLIILRAPLVTPKQVQWLSSHHHTTLVHITSLSDAAMLTWIKQALHTANILYLPEIPSLIQQYTQGNHVACAQAIEKLALTYIEGTTLTSKEVLPHLSDQCDYQLYELADACLTGNTSKALHLIKLASENRTEAVLILWLLTQEIRLLVQLSAKTHQQNESFASACRQLNIWPQRMKNYERALKHLSQQHLHALLQQSQHVDEAIKTGLSSSIVWQNIEQIALKLSLCS